MDFSIEQLLNLQLSNSLT